MFQELEDEYNPNDYETDYTIKLDEFPDENDNYDYEYEMERPYGKVTYSIWSKPKEIVYEEDLEMKPLTDDEKEYVIEYWEPKPISRED